MRLYLDTADRRLAEPWLGTGLFAGLTTNPTILQRSGLGVEDIGEIYRWGHAAGAHEIFFQAWGEETDLLVERGLRLRDLGDEVVVKVPASRAGTVACANLAARGVPTLLTAVYSVGQAMVASAAQARYIAPYLGKLNDAGRDGEGEVAAMHELLVSTGSSTQVLAASIRDVSSMVSLARRGIGCFTFGPAIAEEFFTDELTAEAVRTFEEAVHATSLGDPHAR